MPSAISLAICNFLYINSLEWLVAAVKVKFRVGKVAAKEDSSHLTEILLILCWDF